MCIRVRKIAHIRANETFHIGIYSVMAITESNYAECAVFVQRVNVDSSLCECEHSFVHIYRDICENLNCDEQNLNKCIFQIEFSVCCELKHE